MNLCECGCGGGTSGGDFLPGHDQRLRAELERRLGGLLTMRELVEAAVAHRNGETSEAEMSKIVRALLSRPAKSRPS